MAAPRFEIDITNRGQVLADVTVYTGPFILKGFRIMAPSERSKSKGPWVGYPSRKVTSDPKRGRGKQWWECITDIDANRKGQFEDMMMQQYEAMKAVST